MRSRTSPSLLVLLALLGAAGPRGAADEPPPPSAPPAAPSASPASVELLLLTGAPERGALERLSAQAVLLAGATPRPLEQVRDLVGPAAPPAAAPADRLQVRLVGGDEWLAETWAPAGEGLRLGSPAFGVLELPFDAIASLAFVPSKAGPCYEPTVGPPLPTGTDAARLVGGDEVLGTVVGAAAAGLTFELERGATRTLGWSELQLATLDNPRRDPPPGGHVEVETHGGDLLVSPGPVEGDAATGLSVPLLSLPGAVARVPLALVARVRWRGPRLTDATRLPFTALYRPLVPAPPGSLAEAFLERDRGARVGRRPHGCALRLRGTRYRHGFAVHSGSEIRLALEGRFGTFETLVGIDDEALEEAAGRDVVPGDVDVRVLGDGKVLFEAQGLTGRAEPRRVGPLPVAGVKELVLVVDYGGHDETLDRVTWAEPLLRP